MAVLSIYKASAGSGKTYTLTREYLKLIFASGGVFSNILAVTFTNKATAEMRERILSELSLMANGSPSDHIKYISDFTARTESDIRTQAKELLYKILHNYSRFNVSTIDSFFQRILKAFTREVGLNVGFNIELNAAPIIEKAVDNLFDDLEDNIELKNWLQKYAFNKVIDGNSWDIHKDLIKFSGTSFSEVFYSFTEEHLNELLNMQMFKEQSKAIENIISEFISKVNEFGKQFFKLIQDNGLDVDDFSYRGAGVAGHMVNSVQSYTEKTFDLPKQRVLNAAESTDGIKGWVTKGSANEVQAQNCVQSGLQSIVIDYLLYVSENSGKYFTAKEVLKNLNVYAVLVEVFKRVLDYCNHNNIFLLPLASPFLAKIIEDDDAPFIYEKTGEYLNHFMIDEFQDTSMLQWRNFYPLVNNGIAQEKQSLVVGDVKQSIYRWRNSNWALLDSGIEEEFKYYDTEGFIKKLNLEYNWRSCENIIGFNNWVFKQGSILAQNQFSDDCSWPDNTIERIYSDGEQRIPESKIGSAGYIQANFFDTPNYEEEALENTIKAIDELATKGYRPKDIAILVRVNKQGAIVAKHLMEMRKTNPEFEGRYRFISNDSVFLGSSDAILLVVSLMSYLCDEESILTRTKVLHFYQLLNTNVEQAVNTISETELNDNDTFLKTLPTEFREKHDEFSRMTLSEISHHLTRIFLINNTQPGYMEQNMPFIHTFQDAVLNYANQNGNDLAGFIEWWDKKGFETPINLSEDQDAIRIMTIHKSKGLEFKAVIMPFVNWKFEPQSALLWCRSDHEPFNKFKLLPINYSSSLQNTFFKDYYFDEKLKSIIDNLNLLYVAYTRARNALYLMAPKAEEKPDKKPGKKNDVKMLNVADLMFKLFENKPEAATLGANNWEWNSEELLFTMGTIPIVKHPAETKDEYSVDAFEFGDSKILLKIKHEGKEIFKLDQDAVMMPKLKGNLYHKIFEFIKYEADIEQAIDKAIRKGLIHLSKRQEILDEIKQFINKSSVNSWFSNNWKVKTEQSILLPNSEVKRPDRVIEDDNEILVIDFKFAKQNAAHHKQVQEYVNALRGLSSKKTSGYLWYVPLNKVVAVL